MYLFLAFLLVPIIEIALFIQVGGLIGLWPTLLIVVLTAMLGTSLVRNQGLMTLGKLQQSFERLENPSEPLAHGAMILISGALLLTPGFFTDAVGFALLVPGIRNWLIVRLSKRVKVQSFQTGAGFQAHTQTRRRPDDGDIIDGEWEEVSAKPRNGPSGWVDDRRD